MLKDLRELGKNDKTFFSDIKEWPEVSFNDEDKQKICEIDIVDSVDNHSIRFSLDENHCIVPSQYVLYSVFIKEFALALREHMDVFDGFKSGKNANAVGDAISKGTYKGAIKNLDLWSETIVLKPITDSNYNFDAKAIINGSSGSYKVRGPADFFASVILKIINVPDASSSILGKFIYKLAGNKDVYSFLEKRFLKKIPFITKENNINKFVFNVVNYLYQFDNLVRIEPFIRKNSDKSFRSIKIDEISLTSIFKAGNKPLTDKQLSQGGHIRYFNTPIYINNKNEFLYLSTEWTAGKKSRLDLDSFESLIDRYYPEFMILNNGGEYIFKAVNKNKLYLKSPQVDFKIEAVRKSIKESGLLYSDNLISRFIASLITKPFVILSGLSGSGKTKLAQAFAMWICQDNSQICIIPVGADWTNREPLLGYPNALNSSKYVKPDNGALKLIIKANENPELPFFLILDEMNLSHVERYFADFLSVMESNEEISLFSKGKVKSGVPSNLRLPKNLFIIGTVNIDETTYMFSPKVLDRANAIEFRVSKNEITLFFENNLDVDLSKVSSKGDLMAESFLNMAHNKEFEDKDSESLNKTLVDFFEQLKKAGAEFGYRSATEIIRIINQLKLIDSNISEEGKIDIAIMQKLLPKLHGSRRKLCPVLITLGGFCVTGKIINVEKEVFGIEDFDFDSKSEVKYPLSLEKITRMYKGAIENGFASYAEA